MRFRVGVGGEQYLTFDAEGHHLTTIGFEFLESSYWRPGRPCTESQEL